MFTPVATRGGAAPASAITIIRPPRRWPGLGLNELWRLRSICLVLAKRNLMARYRQTFVGAAWTIIQPVALMLAFTVFFGLLSRLPSGNLPYAVFYFLAIWPFHMASKILVEGSTSIVSNSALVTRVYFPRVFFPTSVALASLLDLALAGVALIVLLAIHGIVPGPQVIAVPMFITLAWLGAVGSSYWLSAVNVAYRDITQILPFLTQIWMFASPVIYSARLIPEPYRTLYYFNPLAVAIEGMRWAIGGEPAPTATAWLLGTTSAVTLFVTGYLFFRKREPTFSDVV